MTAKQRSKEQAARYWAVISRNMKKRPVTILRVYLVLSGTVVASTQHGQWAMGNRQSLI